MSLTISKIMQASLEATKSKGFRDEDRPLPIDIVLMHSELSEALEEYRDPSHRPNEIYHVDGKPEGVVVEFADVILRICESCAHYKMPLEQAILQKMIYNRGRPYRHGGKRI